MVLEGPERLVANWGAKGYMADLSDIMSSDSASDLYENVKNSCTSADGKVYEYPLCMVAHCMAVNRTMMEKADAMQYIWDGVRIFDEALKGNTDCIKVIDEMCDILGEGIANICYVLNPETVVLGGGIMAREDYLYPKIRNAMYAKMESVIARNTSLKFAEFKNSAGMIGAYYNFRRLY